MGADQILWIGSWWLIMSRTYIHIVWSPQTGPLAAYTRPDLAYNHARTMVGVEVGSLIVLEQMPEVVVMDIESDFDGDDDTPKVVEVELKDIEEREK